MERGTLIPVDEYLSTSYRPDREYVDGALVERNLGERDHSEVQIALSAYLYARRKELNIHVFPEQRVQVKRTRFRVPDICVVAGNKPDEQIFTSPPFLCIEILSKEDRMSEMQERIDDYLSFGVRYVWVIDPRTKRAYVHTTELIQEAKDVLRTGSLQPERRASGASPEARAVGVGPHGTEKCPDIVIPLDEVFGKP